VGCGKHIGTKMPTFGGNILASALYPYVISLYFEINYNLMY
jgi:hypothetical protein